MVTSRIRAARASAARTGADLVVFSELVLCGYPPEDLVLHSRFQASVAAAIDELAKETADGGPGLIVGAPYRANNGVHNSAYVLDGGRIVGVRHKHNLPNYGVFDEKRVFAAEPLPAPVLFRDVRLGVMVCEDMWAPDVWAHLSQSGAEILVVINSSLYETRKQDELINLAMACVVETSLPVIYVPRCSRRVLHCGISVRLKAAVGQTRR